jgi:hypothetical protein
MVICYQIRVLNHVHKIIGVFLHNDTNTNQLYIDGFNNVFMFESQINYMCDLYIISKWLLKFDMLLLFILYVVVLFSKIIYIIPCIYPLCAIVSVFCPVHLDSMTICKETPNKNARVISLN